MPTTLDHRALEAYLPHRGVNMLPDTLTISDDVKTAVSRTRIGAGDPRGRELFGRRGTGGKTVWIEPFIGELLALTGIPLIKAKLDANGHVAVFSALSRITYGGDAPMGAEVVGEAKLTRDRGPFSQFEATCTVDGQVVWQAEIMAGSATMAQVAGQPVQPPIWQAGEKLQADFAWKQPYMRFIDDVQSWDATARKLVAGYRYPENHPLVPGHFPDAALMMGMAQWTAMADAAWEARKRAGITGAVSAAGCIRRPGGGEVLDVRELVIEERACACAIRSAKRVAFREPIRPGDGILVEVVITPC